MNFYTQNSIGIGYIKTLKKGRTRRKKTGRQNYHNTAIHRPLVLFLAPFFPNSHLQKYTLLFEHLSFNSFV